MWSWLGLEKFRNSERRQAKQPNVASWCEEGLTTDACYIGDDDDDDNDDANMYWKWRRLCDDNADSLRKTDAHDDDDKDC